MENKIEFLNEDCFEGMKTIPDHSVDLVLTDPPFACSKCEWDKEVDFQKLREELKRICREKALFVSFSKQPFTTKLMNAFPGCFKDIWYWKKHVYTGFLDVQKRPLRAIEEVLVFKINRTATRTLYNPQMKKLAKPRKNDWNRAGKSELYTDHDPKKKVTYTNFSYPINFLDFNEPQKGKIHPCQKPLNLVKFLMKTYSNEGMTVLDPFAGSCVVGLACRDLGRNFIGFEMDKEIYKKAIERIRPQ